VYDPKVMADIAQAQTAYEARVPEILRAPDRRPPGNDPERRGAGWRGTDPARQRQRRHPRVLHAAHAVLEHLEHLRAQHPRRGLEAMKMEHQVQATGAGGIAEVRMEVGRQVDRDEVLLMLVTDGVDR
jgi:hypothetical protein